MRRPLVCHAGVAVMAEVRRKRDPHRLGDLGTVLAVAGDAAARVEAGEIPGVARVGELRLGMRVFRGLELGLVAVEAGLLADPAEGRVAAAASELDLVMAVRCPARKEEALVAAGDAERQVQGDAESRQNPGESEEAGAHGIRSSRTPGYGRRAAPAGARPRQGGARRSGGRGAEKAGCQEADHQDPVEPGPEPQAGMGDEGDQGKHRDGDVSEAPPLKVPHPVNFQRLRRENPAAAASAQPSSANPVAFLHQPSR